MPSGSPPSDERPWPVAGPRGAGPAPPDVTAALLAVLRDMQAASLIVGVGWVPETATGPPMLFVRDSDGSGVGMPVPCADPAGLAVQIAHGLQDYAVPESGPLWGEARPACPGHGHPAEAIEHDGVAWWRCPASGRLLARLGALGEVEGDAPTGTGDGAPAAPGAPLAADERAWLLRHLREQADTLATLTAAAAAEPASARRLLDVRDQVFVMKETLATLGVPHALDAHDAWVDADDDLD